MRKLMYLLVFSGFALLIGQFLYEWISGERSNPIILKVAYISTSIGLLLRFGEIENHKK